MALNPQYKNIGKGVVSQYYALFDEPLQQPNLIKFHSATDSFISFKGLQNQGAPKIMEKLNSRLTFQKISHASTAIDSQPMYNGGALINVLGHLQCDEEPSHAFSEIFILRPMSGTFACAHDIFRLNSHNK